MYDISVILAFNRIDFYTFDAIDSALGSESVNLQLILVLNGPECWSLKATISKRYGHLLNVKLLATPVGQLAFALNLGLGEADADYIGRMDADDICLPNRFSVQLEFMKSEDLDVLGSDVWLINEHGNKIGERTYPQGTKIGKRLLYSSPFCHPTVVFKKSALMDVRGYNAGFNSEDYDLWLRMKRSGVKWDNVGEKLLMYRVHSGSTQGSALAYAEVCGYLLRELLIVPSAYTLFSFVLSVAKVLRLKLGVLFK